MNAKEGRPAVNYWMMRQHRRLRERFQMATLERNWPRLSRALENTKPQA